MKELQNRVDNLAGMMLEKQLKTPAVNLSFQSNAEMKIELTWISDGGAYKYEVFCGEDLGKLFAKAENAIRAMPDKAERERREFNELLAKAIEHGKNIGLETKILNPLVETMEKISKNVLEGPRPETRGLRPDLIHETNIPF